MDKSWWPPETRPKRPAEQLLMIATTICVSSLLLPQGRFRVVVCLGPLIYLCTQLRTHSCGQMNSDYLSMVNFTIMVLKWLDFVAIRNPEQSLRRKQHDGSVETYDEIRNLSLWAKFRWSLSMFTTYRGIGWNWEVKNVDHVPKATSRLKFVSRAILGASYSYIYLDFCTWLMDRYSFKQHQTMPDFFSLSLLDQVSYTWALFFFNGLSISLIMYIGSAIAVGIGFSTPEDWPAPLGNFSQGYTMRNIWGYCWHQFLRQTFESVNRVLTTTLGIRKGTFFSRYLQLYCAFSVSAFLHHLGAMNINYTPAWRHQIAFFMIQPIAITIEDIAIYTGKKAGLKSNRITKTLGFLWVFLVLSFSGRYGAKYQLDSGSALEKHPFVQGLTKRLLG